MKKLIVMSNNEVKEMDFEETMEQYKGLIIRIAKRYKGINLTEDDMQEGYLGLWKAFTTYDEKHCFSTHLTWKLKERFQHLKSAEVSGKRDKREKTFVNLEYDLGDGNTVGNMIPDENSSKFENDIFDRDIIRYIKDNLNEFEMDLLAFNLKYIKATDIIEKYDTTKQNVSNKNARFKVKLRKLIEDYNRI